MSNMLFLNEYCNTSQGFEILEEKATPGSSWKSLKFRGVFQRADTKNQNGRVYPYKVLDKAIQEASESLMARNMMGELDHPCLTNSNFNVLTESGWKPFLEIQKGEKVWSLQDGMAVLSLVENVINQPYTGEVYSVTGRNINSTFTAPHKFIFKNRNGKGEFKATIKEVAENKKNYTHFPIPKTATFLKSSNDTISIPAVSIKSNNTKINQERDLVVDSKVFAAFMGIYLSEGNVGKNNYHVFISQKVGWTKEYIKTEILDKLSNELIWHEYNNGFGTNDARLSTYLKPLGNKYTKFIPKELKHLSEDCLRELLFWFGIGDGRLVGPCDKPEDISVKQAIANSIRKTLKSKYLKFQLFSVSERLIQDLHECLIYCGESGNKTTIIPDKDYIYAGIIKAENKVPLHILNISSAKHLYISKYTTIKKSVHSGNIYCLTTTHGNFYMEQNGKSFWTGNSDGSPTVSLKNVSHVITNLKFSGKDVIGEALVFDDPGPAGTPAGRLLGALIRNNCTVGISSRGFGSITESYDGVTVDEYKLFTFDAVQDPSTQKAFIHQVNEGSDFKRQIALAVERNNFIESLRNDFSSMIVKK